MSVQVRTGTRASHEETFGSRVVRSGRGPEVPVKGALEPAAAVWGLREDPPDEIAAEGVPPHGDDVWDVGCGHPLYNNRRRGVIGKSIHLSFVCPVY